MRGARRDFEAGRIGSRLSQSSGPTLAIELAAEKAKLEATYEPKLSEAGNASSRPPKPKLSTQRWQFFARLGTALWVIIDNVMAVLGKNLPGRRRSLDPAIRSMATETGQQSNAKITLESAQQEKDRLQQQHDDELKQLETKSQPRWSENRAGRAQAAKRRHRNERRFTRLASGADAQCGAAEPVYLATDK